jgi:signal transduction histidine kinase
MMMPAELRAARFDLVSRLADDLAHEIKNPLHAMVINLEVLRRRVTNGAAADALERADVLEHELHRVNGLVEQILLLLRPDRSGADLVALDTVLGEIVPLIAVRAKAERKEFRFHADADSCLVSGQPDAIKLAVLAVADWATAAVPATGAIVIRSSATADRAMVTVEAHGVAEPPTPTAGSALVDDPIGLARAMLIDSSGDVGATPAGARGYCQVSLTLRRSGHA